MKTVSTSFTITTVISLMMCCTVPAGPPRQFFGTAKSSTSIIVAWGAPATPNGVITEYQLQCSGGGEVFSFTVMGSQTTTTLSGLLPYTSYSCSITAHTSVGGGPAATTSVTTEQDSESISIFYSIPKCHSYSSQWTTSELSYLSHFSQHQTLLVSTSLLTTEWSYH